MLRYLAHRLAASALILIGVSVITFGLTFLIPADPVRMIAGRSASPQAVENIRHQLGLDKPPPAIPKVRAGKIRWLSVPKPLRGNQPSRLAKT